MRRRRHLSDELWRQFSAGISEAHGVEPLPFESSDTAKRNRMLRFVFEAIPISTRNRDPEAFRAFVACIAAANLERGPSLGAVATLCRDAWRVDLALSSMVLR